MSIKKILILVLLFTTAITFSQKKEQIKALKTAFITTELSLTPQEAEKFWPIYNAYEAKQYELRTKKLKSYMNRSEADVDNLSDKEAESLLAQLETVEEETYLNRKKLISSLKNVISAVKIIKLKKVEDDFNRKLLRQYANKRGNSN